MRWGCVSCKKQHTNDFSFPSQPGAIRALVRCEDGAFPSLFSELQWKAGNQFHCRCHCAFAFCCLWKLDNKRRLLFSAIVKSFLPVHRLVFTIAIYFLEDFLVSSFLLLVVGGNSNGKMKRIKRKSSCFIVVCLTEVFSLLIFLLLFHLENLFCDCWWNWKMRKFCCWKASSAWARVALRRTLQLKLIDDKHQLWRVNFRFPSDKDYKVEAHFMHATRKKFEFPP